MDYTMIFFAKTVLKYGSGYNIAEKEKALPRSGRAQGELPDFPHYIYKNIIQKSSFRFFF